ncbi:DUF1801 domain-containing protein [Hyphococcus sp.]|uniref:DUF1801 domain-containing protein n=1 Tax=Hyphococcus sp. TaxID=2038636 RepID=UPI003CCC3845
MSAQRKFTIAPEVAGVLNTYPDVVRKKLLHIRDMIFRAADEDENIGEIDETLKWGEPSYLTSQTKSGSTIRLAWKSAKPDMLGVYFNCNTTLVDSFREMFGETLSFENNRAILLSVISEVPEKELSACFAEALTYHLNKRRR